MKSILDQFTRFKPHAFLPKSATELLALRIAQRLGDGPAAEYYAGLVAHYSEFQLLCAYRRTLHQNGHVDPGRRFVTELERTRPSNTNGSIRMISVRVERRTIAAAIFHGQHLEYTDSRQLSSDRGKAVDSAAGFITWLLSRFPVESAALEAIENGHEIQRRSLHDAVSGALRDQLLPIWEVPRASLLEGYGHPALKTRAELRERATTIWPILAGTHAKLFIQDAAVLGLHVQTERLFIINSD